MKILSSEGKQKICSLDTCSERAAKGSFLDKRENATRGKREIPRIERNIRNDSYISKYKRLIVSRVFKIGLIIKNKNCTIARWGFWCM